MLERQRQDKLRNNQGRGRLAVSEIGGGGERLSSRTSETGYPMLHAIRRTIFVLRQKQILHRLGVAVSITVIGIACYVLYHMLRGIDVDEVIEAIKSTEQADIALAGVFVAAGYFTLTFYDLFAVRAIGYSQIPYRINALAAFTSYSIGHNVGASVFTGGAVRYRIY